MTKVVLSLIFINGIGALTLLSSAPVHAQAPSGSPAQDGAKYIFEESFRGGEQLKLPWISGGSGPFSCLTAGGGGIQPCSSSYGNGGQSLNLGSGMRVTDTPGNGALRLTAGWKDGTHEENGFVILNQDVETNGGLYIEFSFYQYNGSKDFNGRANVTGDGISFFLIDATANPQPTSPGARGAGLGYASILTCGGPMGPGLAAGVLGLGFDRFGNFSSNCVGAGGPNNWYSGTGTDWIVVRGSAKRNYPFARYFPYQGNGGLAAGEGSPVNNRGEARRRVRLSISKQLIMKLEVSSETSTPDNPENLKDISGFVTLIDRFDLTSVNRGEVFPDKIKLGFAGSTARATNFNEVRDLSVARLDPQLVAIAKNQQSTIQVGGRVVSDFKVQDESPNFATSKSSGRYWQWLERSNDPTVAEKYAASYGAPARMVHQVDAGDRMLGTGNFKDVFLNKGQSLDVGSLTADNIPSGYAQVCSAILIESVEGYSSLENAWKLGAAKIPLSVDCSLISKQPSVQIWGGDVRVGAAFPGLSANESATIATSSFSTTEGIFGSWGEYGMLAPGKIASATAGSLSGNAGYPSPALEKEQNLLTFANTNPYGQWTSDMGRVSGVIDTVKKKTSDGRTDARDVGDYRITSDLGQESKTVIIRSSGTVRIDNDITLNDQRLASPSDVKQVIIIAKNIIVKDSVSRVDAWLISQPDNSGSGGIISTCNDIINATGKYYDGLRLGACDKQLRINGLVMGKQLQLRRTYGATDGPGYSTPAEIINMRPDSYLWVMQQTRDVGMIDTLFTTELPPRF